MPARTPTSARIRLDPRFLPGTPAATRAIELLQAMVRIDTTNPPGNETALATALKAWVDTRGIDFVHSRIIGSSPDRGNLIIDIDGADPGTAPSWGFMAHLDVVPAEGDWIHPPFSGDLVQDQHDAFIWGRGSFDVKYLGAAYLVAIFTAIEAGFRPRGNVKILLCADEDQGGEQGVGWLVEHHPDMVRVDCCINEGGGFKIPIGDDFVIQVGEKGVFWTKLKVTGQGGHGSMPPPYDSLAIYKLARVLDRIKRRKVTVEINPAYIATVNALSLPRALKWMLRRRYLLKPLMALVKALTGLDFGQVILPLVTDSVAPTVARAGVKENAISPEAELVLDIRSLPGHDRDAINAMLARATGKDLWPGIEVTPLVNQRATTSGLDNEFFTIIDATMQELYPGANLVPIISQGSTDSKFLRRSVILAFGFCPTIKDDDLTYPELLALAHNANERVSVTNLMLAVDFTYRLFRRA